jgi:acetyl esterase
MNEQPIDPDVLNLFAELMPSADPPQVVVAAEEQTAAVLRQTMRDVIAVFTRDVAPIPVHHVTDDFLAGHGGDIPVRVYSPETSTAIIVYFHGGGWTAGDIDTHDFVTRRLSRDTGAVVVSVDYRMVPEDPFPASFDDAYDAVVWASARWSDLPLLVAGDSAGGTLAACVSLRARDDNGPRIDAQILVYPGIDDDLERPSVLTFSDGPGVTRDDLEFYLRQYAANEAAVGSPYALPGRATALAGLPPAVVSIAGHDILRSSEEDYASRLQAAGVPVIVQFDPELTHAWIDYAPRVRSADRAFTHLTDTINNLIHRATTTA